MDNMNCPKCKSENTTKYSPIKIKKDATDSSVQRYRCKDCGYQFTKSEYVKQSSKEVRYLALELHYMGLTCKEVVDVFNIHSRSLLCYWENSILQSPHSLKYDREKLKTEIENLKTSCEDNSKCSYTIDRSIAKKCLEKLKKMEARKEPLEQLLLRLRGRQRLF